MIIKKMTSLKRIGTFIAAAALTAGMMLAPVFEQMVYAADLPDPVSLTVDPGKDAAGVKDVVIDVYKVASATENSKSVITFDAGSDYANVDVKGTSFSDMLSKGVLTNRDWRNMAAAVAVKAIDSGKGLRVSGKAVNTAIPLHEMGLYLVVAHGKGVKPADYVVKNYKVKGGDGTVEPIVTSAINGQKIYYWNPELICIPSPVDVETPKAVFDTSAADWEGAVSIVLKPMPDDVPPVPETTETTPPTTNPPKTNPPIPHKTPKTGDDTPLSKMLIMAAVSILILILLGIYLVKSRKKKNNNNK